MTSKPLLIGYLFSFGITLASVANQSVQPLLTNLDVFEIEVAVDPQISPNGSSVAYVRQSNDIMTDKTRSNIWQVSVGGQVHRPLLSGVDNYSSPRWSPSGGRLAYVSGAEGVGSQLYIRWMDTGQTALVSNLQSGPGSITWSPDGSTIYFSANRNDDWEYDIVNSEIWTIDVQSGSLTALTNRKGPDYSPNISPDCRWMVGSRQ